MEKKIYLSGKTMNGKWLFSKNINDIISVISDFRCPEVEMVITPIQSRPDFVIFGCYVPSQPRPTSIISGEIFVRSLPDERTEVRITDFPSWAAPFLEALIVRIRQDEGNAGPGDGL
jgi:hypothetical protein